MKRVVTHLEPPWVRFSMQQADSAQSSSSIDRDAQCVEMEKARESQMKKEAEEEEMWRQQKDLRKSRRVTYEETI